MTDKNDRDGNNMSAAENLIALLDLEKVEENLFRGQSPKEGWQRVFGGQVIGQALVAAGRTVPDRTVHSLHAYFLRPGDPKTPIIYNVERTRDGKSFSTRRVTAIQHGKPIFDMSASFQITEPGLEHAIEMPDVPTPDKLPTEVELNALFIDKMPASMKAYWERERPIELRPVDYNRFASREKKAPRQDVWFRATGKIGDDPLLNQCVLAYASDFTLLDTALIAHGKYIFDMDLQLASLDHALWFHRPFRSDEWLLYSQDSPSSQGARGFCRGNIFNQAGELVASVTQEGLMRPRP